MRQAMVFSQDEIREALGYGTLVDETQVLVPSNYMPLSDMRGGDLTTERTMPIEQQYVDDEDEDELDTEYTEDEDEDIDEEL